MFCFSSYLQVLYIFVVCLAEQDFLNKYLHGYNVIQHLTGHMTNDSFVWVIMLMPLSQ